MVRGYLPDDPHHRIVVGWIATADVDWESQPPCTSEKAWQRCRREYLESIDSNVLAEILETHWYQHKHEEQTPLFFLHDPELEFLIESHLTPALTNQERCRLIKALYRTPYDLAPKFRPTEAACLVITNQIEDLVEKLIPPDAPSSIPPSYHLKYLEWRLKAQPVASTEITRQQELVLAWRFPEEGDLARKLLSDDLPLRPFAFRWLTRFAQDSSIPPEVLRSRIDRFPSEAARFLSWLSTETQIALLFAQETPERPTCSRRAVALDLESDGEHIQQIGICWNGTSRMLFDSNRPDRAIHESLDDALQALAEMLASTPLIIGHNLIDWDIPILRSYLPELPERLPIWDTLLISILLNPSAKRHALGGSHRADEDATAAWRLFLKQIASFEPSHLASLLGSDGLSSLDILRLVEAGCPRSPNADTIDHLPWLDPGDLLQRGQSEIHVHPIYYHRIAWQPFVSVLDPHDKEIDPERLADNLDQIHPQTAATQTLAAIARWCKNDDLQLRESMLPMLFRAADKHPEIAKAIQSSRRSPRGMNGHLRIHPASADITAYTNNDPVILPEGVETIVEPEQSLETRKIRIELDRLTEGSASLRNRCIRIRDDRNPAKNEELWSYDATQARLPGKNNLPWSMLKVLPVDVLPIDPRREAVPGLPRTILAYPSSDSIVKHPGTIALRDYWTETLERFVTLSHQSPAPEAIHLLVITSTRSQRFVALARDALTKLRLTPTARDGWTTFRLIQAGISEGKTRFVCLLNDVPRWLAGAEEALPVHVYLESLPLGLWWAMTPSIHKEARSQSPDILETQAEVESEESEESDDESSNDSLAPRSSNADEADNGEIAAALLLQQAGPLIAANLKPWCAEKQLTDCALLILMDPRLRPRHAIDIGGVRSQPCPPRLQPEQRQLIGDTLRDLAPPERGNPEMNQATLRGFIHKHWDIECLRENQEATIPAILNPEADLLVTLPTGEGKSILFQAPALYRGLHTRRLTIVLSPLRALMRDQIEGLIKRGFHQSADYLSADRPWHEIEDVYQGLLDGRIVLIYVAPERLRSRRFQEHLRERQWLDERFEYLVVDEAHCVSQWGYSFRPDYFYALDRLTKTYRRADTSDTTPLFFFSATVTLATSQDLRRLRNHETRPFLVKPDIPLHPIRDHIEIRSELIPAQFRGNRPGDWHFDERFDRILDVIRQAEANTERTGQISTVLVFVKTRSQAEHLSSALRRKQTGNLRIDYFHAGLDADSRMEVYESFQAGDIQVLVATKAFGMGMDIGHIHFAIHLSPPAVLEDYLQEVGRIGRDKAARDKAELDKVTATLLHGPEDFEFNLEQAHRSQIAENELSAQWSALVQRAKPAEGAHLVLLPALGFQPARGNRRSIETGVRMVLYWLERTKRLEIIDQVPGLLPVLFHPTRLRQLTDEPGPLGEVARELCGLTESASPGQQRIPAQTHVTSTSATGSDVGLAERLRAFIGRLVGLVFAESPASNSLDDSPAFIVDATSASPSGLIDIPALFRRISVSHIDDLLKVLRDIEVNQGITLQHELELSPKSLANASEIEIYDLFQSLSETVSGIVKQLRNSRDHRLNLSEFQEGSPFTLPAVCQPTELMTQTGIVRRVPPRLSPRSLEWTVLFVLRTANVRVREQPGDEPEHRWNLSVSENDLVNLSARMSSLITLARRLWDALQRQILSKQTTVQLSQLIDIMCTSVKQFRQHDLRQALGILGKLHLCSVSDDPLGMTYVIALYDKDSPLTIDPELKDELDGVNRMALLRAEAMEIFANLPDPDARKSFIDGYFQVDRPDVLKEFLSDQLQYADTEKSDRMRNKLAQRQESATEALFKRYLDPDAKEPNQWRAISHPAGEHLLVNAGPGAGKTTVLIDRIAHLIDRQHLTPDQILVLAFNRAIVHEIRIRLKDTFEKLGYGAYLRRLRVYTFHGLAARHLHYQHSDSDNDSGKKYLATFADWLRISSNAEQVTSGLRTILIDEYQDLDESIEDIITLLQKQSSASVFAIGDDDQDILGFTRQLKDLESGYDYFRRFCSRYSLNSSQKLVLGINFRSRSEIVKISQNFIRRFFEKKPGSHRWKDQLGVVMHASHDKPGQVERLSDRDEMLMRTLHLIRESEKDNRSIAILCKTNEEVIDISQRIESHNLKVEIRLNETYAICRLRHFGVFFDACRNILDSEGDISLVSIQNRLVSEWQKCNIPETKNIDPTLGTPHDLIELTLSQNRFARLSDILDLEHLQTDEFQRIRGLSKKQSRLVSTIHKVKGLEFDDVVIIPSTINYPFKKKDDPNGYIQNDEARLYYVAMTRAIERLFYSWEAREQAWWEGKIYSTDSHENSAITDTEKRPRRTILYGSLDRKKKEVYISWAAQNMSCQTYIERSIRIGDPIEVNGEKLFHQGSSGLKQIGQLSASTGSRDSRLRVVAVYRYPQKEGDYWHMLCDEVQQRRWSYVVLVAGIL